MGNSYNTTSWFDRNAKYIALGLLALGVVLLVIIAFARTAATGAPAGATPRPVPTFGAADPPAGGSLDSLRTALAAGTPISVAALGSSVGVGATLSDPNTESPSGRLGVALQGLTSADVTVTNSSVNGSVAVDGLEIYRTTIAPTAPTVLLLTYGMNDGMPASFNSGETLPGGMDAIATIASEARAAGTTVLLATTPSPHTGRTSFDLPAGLPVQYPASGEIEPLAPLTDIDGAAFSARHQLWNAALRDVAEDTGATLVDVESSWAAAVVADGEDALFNEAETVHPNLLGHQASYWSAIDELVASLS